MNTQVKSQDKRNFVMVPNGIIRAVHPPYYLSVLLVIASYAGDGGKCFALQDTISKTIGVGTRTVMRAIQYWESLGVLMVERRNGMNSVICTAFDFTKTTCDSRVTGDSTVTGAVTPESQGAVTPESHIRKTTIRKTIKNTPTDPAVGISLIDGANQTAIAAPSGAVEGVNELFKVFYDTVNPGIKFGNKTVRKDAEWLIQKYGLSEIVRLAKWACSIQGQPYAPTIGTPSQLREKLLALQAFAKRNSESKVITI